MALLVRLVRRDRLASLVTLALMAQQEQLASPDLPAHLDSRASREQQDPLVSQDLMAHLERTALLELLEQLVPLVSLDRMVLMAQQEPLVCLVYPVLQV